MDTDCEDGQVCDDNGMCVDDTATCETDDDCDTGEVCDDSGMCVPEAECETDDDCADGEVCNSGMCEAEMAECTDDTECGAGEFCTEAGSCDTGQCGNVSPGEECDPSGDPAGNGLVCVSVGEGNAVCAETETCPAAGSGEPDPCTSGSECLAVGENGAGACIITQCELGADECGDGTACQPVSTDTNLCLATGSGAEGDDCASNFSDLSETRCGDGLFCDLFYTGVCRTPCQDDSACTGLNSCVGDGTGDIYTSPEGFCAEGCTPFAERDVCGDGAGCFPLTADEGLCQEAGDIELYGACQVTACSTDDDCPTDVSCNGDAGICDYGTQCASDGRCVTLEGAADGEDGIGRCLPSCDPTSDTPNDTCPAADPQSFIRFQHLSVSANAAGTTAVDIYVNDNLFEEDATYTNQAISQLDFTAVPPGDHNIKIRPADADASSAPILEKDITLEPNAQMTYVVVDEQRGGGPNVDPSIQSFSTPRGVESAADKIKTRIFHGIPGVGAVDVYVMLEGETPSGTPAVQNMAYGEVSGDTFLELDSDELYDAYIVETGGTDFRPVDDGGNLLGSVEGLGAPAGSVITIAALLDITATPPAALSVPLPYSQEEESRVLGGFCLDLAQTADESSPRSGVCFEACGTADNLGNDLCSETTDNCAPFRANSVCLPSQDIAVGETCSTDAFNPCEAGSYCRAYGDGEGICAKLCTTDSNISNPTLGCPTEEACQEISADYDVGQCGFECTATDFADDSCPENLQNCLTTSTDFCSASGSETGDGCTITPNSCESGNLCRAEIVTLPNSSFLDGLLQPLQPEDGATQSCRTVCEVDPTASETGCPSGEVCALEVGTLSTDWGFCMESVGTDGCTQDNFGQPCDDRGYCGAGQGGPTCLQFCRVGDAEPGCSTGTCQAAFQSPDGTIEGWGICL
jgi:hypothetical protein